MKVRTGGALIAGKNGCVMQLRKTSSFSETKRLIGDRERTTSEESAPRAIRQRTVILDCPKSDTGTRAKCTAAFIEENINRLSPACLQPYIRASRMKCKSRQGIVREYASSLLFANQCNASKRVMSDAACQIYGPEHGQRMQ